MSLKRTRRHVVRLALIKSGLTPERIK